MRKGRLLVGLFAVLAGLMVLPSMASALNFQPGSGGSSAQVGSVSDVATGDFNGDGLDDIASAGGTSPSTNGIDILLADGGGDFTSNGTLDCSNASGCFSLAVGNFTGGDSDLDIFGFPFQSNSTVYTFVGNGSGGFPTRLTMNPNPVPFARNSIAVGNLDGNAVDDIVIGGSGGNYAIGQATGNGTFSFTSGSIPAGNLTSAAMGDFNNDGNNDVAFGDDGGKINVLLGDGGGSLTYTASAENPATTAGGLNWVGSMVSADFNGDGRDDVGVTAEQGQQGHLSSVQTFLGTADGDLVTNPDPSGAVFSPVPPVDPPEGGPNTFSDLVTADFDQDGTPGDLAYLSVLRPNGPNLFQSSIRLSNGAGAFTAAQNSPFTYNHPTNLWGQAQGDFNGDGAPDLVAAAPGSGGAAPVLMSFADVSTDPGSIDFGNVELGDQGGPTTLDINNTGAPTAHLSGFTIDGTDAADFSIDSATACTSTVNTACEKDITFTPSSTGAKSATLHISNADGPNLTVDLSGTGTQPQASFDPASPYDFGPVRVGTTSAAQTITVTSSGTAPLQIGDVAESAGDSGSFEIVSGSDNCSNQTIQPASTCTFQVTMSPQLAFGTGVKNLVIDVPSNDPDLGDQTYNVSGTSVDPGIALDPTSHDFGTHIIGTSGTNFTININSNGTTPLHVDTVSITGVDASDFVINDPDCNNVDINPSAASCTVEVIFNPGFDNHAARTAQLSVSSNATAQPVTATLTGTATYEDLSFNPDPVDFGNVNVGQAAPTQTITVTDTGTAPTSIVEVGLNGPDSSDYQRVSNTCDGANLTVGGTCQIVLKFTPSDRGVRHAELRFETATDFFYLEAAGTGIDPAGSLNPSSQDFGSVTVGSSSAAKAIAVKSTGQDPLNVTSASITGTDAGSFSLANAAACNGPQATTCDLNVTFSPTGSPGARLATLSVVTNAGTITSALTGTAAAVPVPPVPKAAISLKAAKKVKPGKTLVVTATVSNRGSGVIAGIVVAAVIAKKLAITPPKIKISSLAPGKSIKKKLKVKVKKSAKPGKKLTVTVSAKAGGKQLASKKIKAKIKK